MKKALLIRKSTSDQGTFGLFTTGSLTLFSGELPWRDNKTGVSCIPEGSYRCSIRFSPRFKRELYAVNGVKDRVGVLIHSANFMGDPNFGYKYQLQGCIALGEKMGIMDGQKALLLSMPAVRRFMDYMAGEEFTLEVSNEFTR